MKRHWKGKEHQCSNPFSNLKLVEEQNLVSANEKRIYRNIVSWTVFRRNDLDKLLMIAISLRNNQGRVHAY